MWCVVIMDVEYIVWMEYVFELYVELVDELNFIINFDEVMK